MIKSAAPFNGLSLSELRGDLITYRTSSYKCRGQPSIKLKLNDSWGKTIVQNRTFRVS